jgi:hypothetical protein
LKIFLVKDITREPKIEEKIPSKIVQFIRNRNSQVNPGYFTYRLNDELKFGTIEYTSQTFREFELPKIKVEECSFFPIKTTGAGGFWQEMGIIVTKTEGEGIEQSYT